MSEHNTNTVNVDELTPIGASVGAGRYTARLATCEGKNSKANKPMVEVEWDILSGSNIEGEDETGNSIRNWHSLTVSEKNGKKYAGGIIDIKKTFANIGSPLPSGYPFPLAAPQAAALFAKKLAGKNVELVVVKEKSKTETDSEGNAKVYTRVQVVGLAAGAAASHDDTGISMSDIE